MDWGSFICQITGGLCLLCQILVYMESIETPRWEEMIIAVCAAMLKKKIHPYQFAWTELCIVHI